MALFEYFPNYIWNLSLAIAIESGAPLGDILDVAAPVKDAANNGPDAGTAESADRIRHERGAALVRDEHRGDGLGGCELVVDLGVVDAWDAEREAHAE